MFIPELSRAVYCQRRLTDPSENSIRHAFADIRLQLLQKKLIETWVMFSQLLNLVFAQKRFNTLKIHFMHTGRTDCHT